MTTAEYDTGRVHIRQHELHLRAGRGGETTRLLEGRRREIDPRHTSAEPRQRDRVGADMTLQMYGIEPSNIPEPRHVEPHNVAQKRRIVREAAERVVG